MKSLFVSTRSQSGVGLVELMVALLLSVIIGGAVVQVFISQRESFRTQDDLARLQENARFAFEQISKDLRHVGFWGCSRRAPITNETGVAALDDIADKAVGESGGALQIKFLNPDVVATDVSEFDALADTRMVSDCAKATVFSSDDLPTGYGTDGWQAFGLSEVEYKVENGGLFRQENDDDAENLIADGVVSISFRYGLAGGDGFVESYSTLDSPPTTTSQWASVVSIETTLVMQGEVIGEKRFVSLVAIRNRLP